jgi:hypothetical protein
MEFLDGLKTFEFSKHGLIGAVVGGLFVVVIKVLMMIDKYNHKLFDIIEDQQDSEDDKEKDTRSWSERNREK